MAQAPQRIHSLATELQHACSPGECAEYVGYKLTAAIARQIYNNLSSPALALEYAKRIQLILLEVGERTKSGQAERKLVFTTL